MGLRSAQDPISSDTEHIFISTSRKSLSSCSHSLVPVLADSDPGARHGSQFVPGNLRPKSSSGIFQCQAENAGRAVELAGAARGSRSPSRRGLPPRTPSSCHEDSAHELRLTCQETGSVSLSRQTELMPLSAGFPTSKNW